MLCSQATFLLDKIKISAFSAVLYFFFLLIPKDIEYIATGFTVQYLLYVSLSKYFYNEAIIESIRTSRVPFYFLTNLGIKKNKYKVALTNQRPQSL